MATSSSFRTRFENALRLRSLVSTAAFVSWAVFFLSLGLAEHLQKTPVMSYGPMVTAAHPLASQIGLQILREGGNAFDAAVAVAAILPLLEPGASGLGGAGAALFYVPATSEVKALSWFTRSPVAAQFGERRRELLDPDSPVRARPPGSLAGLTELLEAYGTMSLKQVLAPAIHYAEHGVVVTPRMHRTLARSVDRLRKYPNAAAAYLVDGDAPAVGSILRLPQLARTMRLIAANGKDVVYKGQIGQEIVTFMAQIGGLIGWKDLELASQPTWHDKPLMGTYRGYTVYAVPPVANGVELLMLMNMLEGFDLKSLTEIKRAHALAEVFKTVAIARDTYLGDPSFVEIPIEKLLSKSYAEEKRSEIQGERVLPWILPYPSVTTNTSESTTHFVVVDEARNIVSVTNSVGGIGENWHIGDTGLIFSAGVSGMSQNPKHPNYAEPGKYQQMTMGPVIVLNQEGQPVLALGAAGGKRIAQAIAQAIVYHVDFGLNGQEALNAPRVSYGGPGAPLTVSADFSSEVIQALKDLGHEVRLGESAVVHAITLNPATGVLVGGADPTAEGIPATY